VAPVSPRRPSTPSLSIIRMEAMSSRVYTALRTAQALVEQFPVFPRPSHAPLPPLQAETRLQATALAALLIP
jgi:hypothetical protein